MPELTDQDFRISEETAQRFCHDWGIMNKPLEAALQKYIRSAILESKSET